MGVHVLGVLDRLGGHVERCAGDRAGGRQAGATLRVHRPGQAEIEDLDEVGHAAASVQQDVGRLDVAVDQADGMGLGQRAADLDQDVDDPALGLGAVALDEGLEVEPVEVLHRVIEDPLGRAAVIVDGDGVGVVEPAGQLHLALEAGDGEVVGLLGAEQLDGGGAAEHGMVGAVDGPMPPSPIFSSSA
jgi:hypothetical protein